MRAGYFTGQITPVEAPAKKGTVTVAADEHIRPGAGHHGQAPLGRLVAYSHAGVEPRIMGIGPVPAVRLVLEGPA